MNKNLVECFDCGEFFTADQVSNKYADNPYRDAFDIMWCKGCEEEYDPTPQEQWEVTTPEEVYYTDKDFDLEFI